MKPRDVLELVALAAIWGASFLFMRMGAADFGPAPLSWLRVAGASVVLLPLLAMRGELPALRQHWKAIALVGLTNSALPFLLFSYAALAITAGLSSIFNATTPLFGALFAALWLRDRLGASRLLGLAIGFAGVVGLAWDKASLRPEAHGVSSAIAIAACLAATLLYGFSASFAKKRLAGVSPFALATGSQVSAAVVLALPAWWSWPAVTPGPVPWLVALTLAVLCTAVAYVLYFRLIAHVGATNAVSVTFLIPAFAVLWGFAFLGETLTPAMVLGCAVILVGTSLVTGLVRLPMPARRAE